MRNGIEWRLSARVAGLTVAPLAIYGCGAATGNSDSIGTANGGSGAAGVSSAPSEASGSSGFVQSGVSGAAGQSGTETVNDASTSGAAASAVTRGGASGGMPAGDDAGSASDASIGSDGGNTMAREMDGGLQPYKGLASYNGCTDISALNLSWYYNWTAGTNCKSSAEFVPQIWGHAGENIAGEVTSEAAFGYKTILGFNEPDNATQSNISVANAIAMWPKLTNNPALRVGSPATQANTAGQAWFTSFMKEVNADTTGTLRVDFITMHWYGWNAGSCEPTANTLESYIKWVEAIPGNRPIWLTEWACSNLSDPTSQTVQAFLTGAVAMLARHPRVVRYGWFTSRSNDNDGLVTTAGALTPLGSIYAKAASEK